jgi:hypothetical protein
MRKQILNFFLDESMMFSVFCDWVTEFPIGHNTGPANADWLKKGEGLA